MSFFFSNPSFVLKEDQRKLITETVKKGASRESSLAWIYLVCHQRYYGGIFVGNHVHKILKVLLVMDAWQKLTMYFYIYITALQY